MTEFILREVAAENVRMRDRLEDQNRVAAVERAHAVLLTRFEAWVERAVTGEDLKSLKREMETELQQTFGSLSSRFDDATNRQSEDLLGKVKNLLAQQEANQMKMALDQQAALSKEQRAIRWQIGLMLLGTFLSIIGALVIFWITRK